MVLKWHSSIHNIFSISLFTYVHTVYHQYFRRKKHFCLQAFITNEPYILTFRHSGSLSTDISTSYQYISTFYQYISTFYQYISTSYQYTVLVPLISISQGWELARSLIAHSLIPSFCSNQMSDCEPFAQIAQDK